MIILDTNVLSECLKPAAPARKSPLSSTPSTARSSPVTAGTHRASSIRVDVYDPWIDRAEAQHEYGLHCLAEPPGEQEQSPGPDDALIPTGAQREFIAMGVGVVISGELIWATL